jgi:cytochrome c oxidase subunit IV
MHSHIIPRSTYFTVFVVLVGLLVVTVLAAQVDVGPLNAPVAMLIALAKAVLIVLYFMHVRYGSPLLRVFAAGGFLWLMIMFALMMPDYLTRATAQPNTQPVNQQIRDPD